MLKPHQQILVQLENCSEPQECILVAPDTRFIDHNLHVKQAHTILTNKLEKLSCCKIPITPLYFPNKKTNKESDSKARRFLRITPESPLHNTKDTKFLRNQSTGSMLESSFTICLWIQLDKDPSGTDSYGTVISNSEYYSKELKSTISWELILCQDAHLEFNVTIGKDNKFTLSSISQKGVASSSYLQHNHWHHVAITFNECHEIDVVKRATNRTSCRSEMYIDGGTSFHGNTNYESNVAQNALTFPITRQQIKEATSAEPNEVKVDCIFIGTNKSSIVGTKKSVSKLNLTETPLYGCQLFEIEMYSHVLTIDQIAMCRDINFPNNEDDGSSNATTASPLPSVFDSFVTPKENWRLQNVLKNQNNQKHQLMSQEICPVLWIRGVNSRNKVNEVMTLQRMQHRKLKKVQALEEAKAQRLKDEEERQHVKSVVEKWSQKKDDQQFVEGKNGETNESKTTTETSGTLKSNVKKNFARFLNHKTGQLPKQSKMSSLGDCPNGHPLRPRQDSSKKCSYCSKWCIDFRCFNQKVILI